MTTTKSLKWSHFIAPISLISCDLFDCLLMLISVEGRSLTTKICVPTFVLLVEGGGAWQKRRKESIRVGTVKYSTGNLFFNRLMSSWKYLVTNGVRPSRQTAALIPNQRTIFLFRGWWAQIRKHTPLIGLRCT